MEQRSPEWFASRRGIITASSRVARILNGNPKTWANLMDELDEELRTGVSKGENLDVPSLRWGREQEEVAKDMLEMVYDYEIESVGLLYHPEMNYLGASPDGVIVKGPVLEIKCPQKLEYHRQYYTYGMPAKFAPQTQTEMLCSGKSQCLFTSFHPHETPRKQLYTEVIEADIGYQRMIEEKVREFWTMYQSGQRPTTDNNDIPTLF